MAYIVKYYLTIIGNRYGSIIFFGPLAAAFLFIVLYYGKHVAVVLYFICAIIMFFASSDTKSQGAAIVDGLVWPLTTYMFIDKQ